MSQYRVQRVHGRDFGAYPEVYNDPIEFESLTSDRESHADYRERPLSWISNLHCISDTWPNGIVLRSYGLPDTRTD